MTAQSQVPGKPIRFSLYAVRVFVRDWERALVFYRDTLGLALAYANADIGWAEFDLGGARLGLERCDAGDREAAALVGRFVGMSLSVDDIDEAWRTLSGRGVRFDAPPERQPWGGVLAHFRDPEDNVLTLLGEA